MRNFFAILVVVLLLTSNHTMADQWSMPYPPVNLQQGGRWEPVISTPPTTMSRVVIQSATYSSMRRECDATRYVAQACRNGGGNCVFNVSNNMCGDPDHGKQKVLQVVYQCASYQRGQWYINTETMSAEAFEHHTIEVSCGN